MPVRQSVVEIAFLRRYCCVKSLYVTVPEWVAAGVEPPDVPVEDVVICAACFRAKMSDRLREDRRYYYEHELESPERSITVRPEYCYSCGSDVTKYQRAADCGVCSHKLCWLMGVSLPPSLEQPSTSNSTRR